jgi:putative SOS response-associated peptidase YedK
MCGRYTIYQTGELKSRFKLPQKEIDALHDELKARYNAAPGQNLPVVTSGDEGRHIGTMRWGLIPAWAKDEKVGYRLINARDDSVFTKPTWKRPVLHNRCLVPANGFYEWKRTGKEKQPFYARPKGTDLFSFAGLFDHWTNKETGEVIESFSIITTEPNKEMRSIHNRMPVILKPTDEESWLDPSHDTAQSLEKVLHPYKDDGLEIIPVSTDVNRAWVDDEHLIYPLPQQSV